MAGRYRLRRTGKSGRAGVTMAFWLLLMFVWLGGLLLGLLQAWPVFQAATVDLELVATGMWLIIGFSAWLVALNFGWQRYRPR